MTDELRERFDALVDRVLESLPRDILAMFEEVPLLVDDEPDAQVMRELGLDPSSADDRASLCGLHSGLAITERSVEVDGVLPSQVHIYRLGIVSHAGGWGDEAEVQRQIRITILHELGHEFGLDEDELDELGYA